MSGLVGSSRDWGARLDGDAAHLALWAPGQDRIALRAGGQDRTMQRDADGWFTLSVPDLTAGAEYLFVLPDGTTVPDPAARQQSGDVHGPSLIVDPNAYHWRQAFPDRTWEEAVIYELHIGAFTPEGTFEAARERLGDLAALGVTVIELMPVAQFAGDRGWGYDGVLPYAVHPAYGTPDDLRALVDAAHGLGLLVLLDVVYNHFGPEGNYLNRYAPDFFDDERQTPWGAAIAYHRPPVRNFFIGNALYWLRDFRFDGLRLDAIDQVRDRSEPEILVELAQTVRTQLDRPLHLTTEDNRNIVRLHERRDGRVVLYTSEWNDDFHNAAHVITTGEVEGYYADFAKDPHALLARALAEGFAYQGQATAKDGIARGAPSDAQPPVAFIDFVQNHDQTGNRAFGERLNALAPDAAVRALRAILLLSPHVPLIFMGEEYGERQPFLFFTDFEGDLADAVREGRRREFAGFASFDADGADLPDPNALRTFEMSKLNWARLAGEGADIWHETQALLSLRKQHVVPWLAGTAGGAGKVVQADQSSVAVDWQLAGGLLELRANLSATPKSLAPVQGEVIYSTSPVETPEAWQVVVSVFQGDSR